MKQSEGNKEMKRERDGLLKTEKYFNLNSVKIKGCCSKVKSYPSPF